jgi:serine protease Do
MALGLVVLLAYGTVQGATPEARDQPAISEAEAVRHVLPSVVNLTVWKPEKEQADANVANAAAAAADRGVADAMEPTEQYYGSGFIVDPSGLILTNRHVVEGASDIIVTFSDGTQAPASVCATCELVDLAIVKVADKKNLPAITWGDSEALRIGDRVLAIGNPLGIGESVSGGIVSALHRRISANPFDDFIQTDAAINHGNSGGVLINSSGAVVGVNTAFFSDRANGGSLGIGFAVPASEARHAVGFLKDCSNRPPGWIGVTVQEVTPDIAQAVGLSRPTGSIVTEVVRDGPAARAGIQEGDVLETANGAVRPTPVAMLGFLALTKIGSSVRLGYWRDGHAIETTVAVDPWPGMGSSAPRNKIQQAAMQAMSMRGLGIRFVDQPSRSGPSRVMVVSVGHGSGASDAGLRPGDVVLRVEHQPAESADSVQAALREAMQAGRHSALLLVESGGRRRFVTVPLETS